MAYDLTARLTMVDRLSQPMRRVSRQMQDTERVTKRLGNVLKVGLVAGATAAAAALAGVGVAAWNAAQTHQQNMRDIQVGTGATGESLEELEEVYKNVGRNVPNDLGEVASAVANLDTLTGASGETLEGLTKQVLDVSRMLGEDGVGNSESFGRALNQWGRDADEGEAILDSLFKATQDYGIGLDGVMGKLNNYGATLQNAGFTMEESADFFGRLEAGGVQVSRIMPGLNRSFRNWASEGKDAQDELQNVIDRMRDAETSTEALAVATDVFGAEGAQRMTAAVRSNLIPDLDDLGTALMNTEGLIQETSDESMTWGEMWSMIGNKASIALQPIGERLLELAQDFLPHVIDGIDRLGEWLEDKLPKAEALATEAIERFNQAIDWMREHSDILVPILLGLGAVVGGVLTFALWSAAAAGWAAVAPWLPFIAVGILVAGLIAGLIYIWNRFGDTIMDFIGNVIEWATDKIDAFGQGFVDAWETAKNGAIGAVNAIIRGVNRMIEAINGISVDIPSWVPRYGGESIGFNIPTIPEIGGSHYHGLDYVPHNGYVARLHEGEAVLNRGEAKEWRDGGDGGDVVVSGNTFYVREEADIDKVARALVREMRKGDGDV